MHINAFTHCNFSSASCNCKAATQKKGIHIYSTFIPKPNAVIISISTALLCLQLLINSSFWQSIQGVTAIKCDRLCKKGSYSFFEFSTLVNHISLGFEAITSIITPNYYGMIGGTLRPSFKVVPHSQVKLWVLKYMQLGSAIRPFLQSRSQMCIALQ